MAHVSVIIPTLNRAGSLANVVRYFLEREPYRDFELIVVDQSDERNSQLESMCRNSSLPLRYFHVGFRQTTRARNFGVTMSSGELIVFSEDDVEPWAGILSIFVDHFRDLSEIGATGPVLLPGQKLRGRSDVSMDEMAGLASQQSMCFDVDFPFSAQFAAGGNSAFRRKAIVEVGGFDENYVGNAWGEELEFSYRIRRRGGVIRYLPGAGCVHLVSATGGSRSALPAAYVSDFVRNAIYTEVRTTGSLVEVSAAIWRCFRRLVICRSNIRSGRAVALLLPFLRGVARGIAISCGPGRLPL